MIETDLEFEKFVRTPFQVSATRITKENMEEVAKLVGEVLTEDGNTFIALDRKRVPNVARAHVGWYLTRLGTQFRCYAPKVFKEQFMPMPDGESVSFSFRETGESVLLEEVWGELKPVTAGRVEAHDEPVEIEEEELPQPALDTL